MEMEDVVYYLFAAIMLIVSIVSSINKKKQEAERRASQSGHKPKGLVSKSLSEVIRELEERGNAPHPPVREPEPAFAEAEEDYYDDTVISLEEQAMAARRLEAMTYREGARKHVAPAVVPAVEEYAESVPEEFQQEILAGGFDLKRAIIESEILLPKYEQY